MADGRKMTFISRKYEEIQTLKILQNFNATMLPFFNPINYPFLTDFYSSIMASDSQSYDQPEYQSQPGRSTPPPTTSYTKPELPKPEDSTAIEPKEDKDEKKDEGEFSRPDANPDYKPENANQEGSKKSDFRGGSGDSKGDKDDKGKDGDKGEDKEGKKMNGGDVLDAQWVRPEELREEKEEENCAVNCIYYTMQCCECTIT